MWSRYGGCPRLSQRRNVRTEYCLSVALRTLSKTDVARSFSRYLLLLNPVIRNSVTSEFRGARSKASKEVQRKKQRFRAFLYLYTTRTNTLKKSLRRGDLRGMCLRMGRTAQPSHTALFLPWTIGDKFWTAPPPRRNHLTRKANSTCTLQHG